MIVVTGANGFVGSHVVALAAEAGHEVWAIGRESSPPPTVKAHATRYSSADLSEGWPISEDVDAVVHLAGLAAVGPSFAEPQRYFEINSRIMTHLGERLIATGAPTRIVVVSSGAVYAPTESGTVDEFSATTTSSPYVVAKLLVENQAHYYATRGVDVVVARPFNHIGPGQSPGFIVPDLTAAVRDAAPGGAVRTGNLHAQRDYSDVRDVARAHLTLATAPAHRHSIYNISTGTPHSGEEMLRTIADVLGRTDISSTVDPTRIRPNDPPRIAGDSSRLQSEFGWRPTIPWEQSVRDYIDTLSSEREERRSTDRPAGERP
ncbi:NAD-dependent epimerase/dehydratase family protein [Microbacterium enclense]|uniref:NAD-dependent epimerase/dehydratase family protein n=1 Tax=Microbacterium enclense TaxID=993073 RepID=UPI0021A95209|nr:NAD-dependent epimerase/dehydratase family protein [Microbacterium enclense]MCT2085757.1 NAD-dependent epimerase/dehydratase family protein [Microbacterium enclense]